MSISSAFAGASQIIRKLQRFEPDFMHKNRIKESLNGVIGWISHGHSPLHADDTLQDDFITDYKQSRKECGLNRDARFNSFEEVYGCLGLATGKTLNRLYEEAPNDIYSKIKMDHILNIMAKLVEAKTAWEIAPETTQNNINKRGLKTPFALITPQNFDDALLHLKPPTGILDTINRRDQALKAANPHNPKLK